MDREHIPGLAWRERRPSAVTWAIEVDTGYDTLTPLLIEMATLAKRRADGRWTFRCKRARFLGVCGGDEMNLSWSLHILKSLDLVAFVGEPGGVEDWALNVGADAEIEKIGGRRIRPRGGRRLDQQQFCARIVDTFDEHPKVIGLVAHDDSALAGVAVALWTLGITWVSRQRRTYRRTFVPTELPDYFFPGLGSPAADLLTSAGLWERDTYGWRYIETDGLFEWSPIDARRPHIPASVRQQVQERDGHACTECGAVDDLTLDHVHPWSHGGEDTVDNLRVLCRPCNSRKGARV